MNTRTHPIPREMQLDHAALYSLPDGSGLAVTCEEGALWLTVDGDSRDFVLEAGERFETPDHGRVLIYALAPSRVGIVNARPAMDPAPRRRARFTGWLSAAGHA